MTVLININFGAQADDTILDDLLAGVSYSPSYPATFKVKDGQLVPYAVHGDPEYSSVALIDTGLTVRRERFVLDQGGSKVIAARDLDTPMVLILANGNLTFVASDFYVGSEFDEITRGFMEAPSTGKVSVEVRYPGDGTLRIFVNNKPARALVQRVGADIVPVDHVTLPTGFDNGLTGFMALEYGGGTKGCASWIVRDESDIVSIDRTLQRRASATTSKIKLAGYIDVAGATSVSATIKDAAGSVIAASAIGTVSGNSFEVITNEYPASYASQSIDLHVEAVGGSGYDDLYVIAPETFDADPVRLGMNHTFLNYYGDTGEWRDLRNIAVWYFGPSLNAVLPYQPADLSVFDTALPASDVGLTRYQVPRHWSLTYPDDPISFSTSFFWMPSQTGDYVLDLSEQPGLVPELAIFGTDVHVSLGVNEYAETAPAGIVPAPGKHRLTLGAQDHSGHVDAQGDGFDNWSIRFQRTTGTLIDKDWNFSIRRIGDLTPERYSSDEHYAWWAGLGSKIVRFMSDTGGNEPYGNYLAPKTITAQWRQPIDGCWTRGPGRPIEEMAQLAAATGQALWRNLHRAVSDDFIGAEMGFLMEHHPELEVIFEPTNEPWNFSFGQFGALEATGYKAGLGAESARFGRDNGTFEIPANHDLAVDYVEGDRVRTSNGLWIAKPGTTVGLIPEYDPAHWTLWQSSGLAQRRALSELTHMIADRVKGACGPALYGTRYKIVAGTFQQDVHYTDEVLKWGNLGAKIHGIASATYFGAEVADPAATRSAASVAAAPGVARQNLMMDVMEASAEEVVQQWIDAQRALRAINATYGWSLKLLCYEGGHHLIAANPSIADGLIDQPYWEGLIPGASAADAWAAFQRMQADIQAMLDSERFGGIYFNTAVALGEVAGGDVVWFDAFGQRYRDHNAGQGFYFGISANPLDFSRRYLSLRDAAIELGAFTPAAPHRRRTSRASRSWRAAA